LYNTTGTMAGLVILMSIVMIMNWILDRAERRVLSWRPKQRGAGADIA
jgi:ABC-type nitrate/sulfonate/bicarbonate transport system permease component